MLVNTTVWMPALSDEQRNVARWVPLTELPAELPALHADAAAGTLPGGKVVITVADA